MLNSKNLNDKTYEELIAEAISQIPLYSSEWSNYNPSDPGITIIENLSAFQILQQEELNEVTPAMKLRLLKMAGFVPKKGQAARVLLQADQQAKEVCMTANQQVRFGMLCFEFLKESLIGMGRIQGIYTELGEEVSDNSMLLEEYRMSGGRLLFGEKPQTGQSIYFVLDDIPKPLEQLIISIDIWEEFPRSKLKTPQDYECADIVWSLLTGDGYTTLEVQDTTCHFLQNGALYLNMPKAEAKISKRFPTGGYLIRGTFRWADYDIAPKVQAVRGFLTEVIQQDTKSVVLSLRWSHQIIIQNALSETGYFFVYVREAKGDYYAYTEQKEAGEGRYYSKKRIAYGQYELTFSGEPFGYEPLREAEDTIIVVCYKEEMMLHRQLGKACGYDEQQLDLSPFLCILPETFSIMACRKDEEGIERYAFFKPDMSEEDSLYYSLEEDKAVIHDCGLYEEAVLSIAGCAVYQGDKGNILKGNVGYAKRDITSYRFSNPTPGQGGAYTEGVEEVRKRFVRDLRSPASIVTKEDCEYLVRNIPGLSIHKVKAYPGSSMNTICVVVKPHSREQFPKLSESYFHTIAQYIDRKRMLTTRIEIKQPVYIQINVSGIIYTKGHYTNAGDKIQKLLQESLDYVTTDKEFGSLISFHELYNAIEQLECVESIYELSILPESMRYITQIGLDLLLKNNCLCYLGGVNLELNRNAG